MNKVKIVLSVIVIMTTIGGVAAFKATKRNMAMCTTIMIGSGLCPTGRLCGPQPISAKFVNDNPNICVAAVFVTNCHTFCEVLKNTAAEAAE
jgi:hypothetical protein